MTRIEGIFFFFYPVSILLIGVLFFILSQSPPREEVKMLESMVCWWGQNINEAFVNKKLVVVLGVFIGVGAFQNGK